MKLLIAMETVSKDNSSPGRDLNTTPGMQSSTAVDHLPATFGAQHFQQTLLLLKMTHWYRTFYLLVRR
jgi:hypothetical protein